MFRHTLTTTQKWGKKQKQPTLEKKKNKENNQDENNPDALNDWHSEKGKQKNRRTVSSYNALRDLSPTLAPLTKEALTKNSSGPRILTYHGTAASRH